MQVWITKLSDYPVKQRVSAVTDQTTHEENLSAPSPSKFTLSLGLSSYYSDSGVGREIN